MTSSLILPQHEQQGFWESKRDGRPAATITLTPLQSWNDTFTIDTADLPVLIGRGELADIRLDDPWVSRRHCEFDLVDGELLVRDLGSKHGVCVNGKQVDSCRLVSGDSLCIGLQVFDVKIGE